MWNSGVAGRQPGRRLGTAQLHDETQPRTNAARQHCRHAVRKATSGTPGNDMPSLNNWPEWGIGCTASVEYGRRCTGIHNTRSSAASARKRGEGSFLKPCKMQSQSPEATASAAGRAIDPIAVASVGDERRFHQPFPTALRFQTGIGGGLPTGILPRRGWTARRDWRSRSTRQPSAGRPIAGTR